MAARLSSRFVTAFTLIALLVIATNSDLAFGAKTPIPGGAKPLPKPCADCAKQHGPTTKRGSVDAMLVSVRQKVTEHKYAEAEALARRAEKAAGRNVEMRARALGELGYVLSAELKFEPAAEAINESLKLRKSRMTTAAEMDDMAVQLQNLAGLQRRAGQRPAARKSMDEATALVEKTHGKNAEVTQLFRNAARAFPKQ